MRAWLLVLIVSPALAGTPTSSPAKPPHGANKLVIDFHYTSFGSTQRHYELVWNADGSYHVGKRTVPPAKIEAVYGALTELQPAEGPLRCISHYDDYPATTIVIEGDEAMTVSSTSNCHAREPWNVERGGKQLVQFTGAVAPAIGELMLAIDPDVNKIAVPVATCCGGGEELVAVSEYTAGSTAVSPAAACAHDLEAGKELVIDHLALICDLAQSKDCTKNLVAAVEGKVDGVSVELTAPCPGGKVDQSGEIATLRALLATKVVKTARSVSKDMLRVRQLRGGGYRVLGDVNMPELQYVSRRKMFVATAQAEKGVGGAAFWKMLKIDPRPFTKRDVDWNVTTVKLTSDGEIVR